MVHVNIKIVYFSWFTFRIHKHVLCFGMEIALVVSEVKKTSTFLIILFTRKLTLFFEICFKSIVSFLIWSSMQRIYVSEMYSVLKSCVKFSVSMSEVLIPTCLTDNSLMTTRIRTYAFLLMTLDKKPCCKF